MFPFLLPIRKWQRKKLFYLEMLLDGNRYAKKKSKTLLPNNGFKIDECDKVAIGNLAWCYVPEDDVF